MIDVYLKKSDAFKKYGLLSVFNQAANCTPTLKNKNERAYWWGYLNTPVLSSLSLFATGISSYPNSA